MTSATYTRYELLRTVRERRLMFFGFGFPLVLYFIIAVPNRHMQDFAGSGVTAPLYYMVSLASFGTMMSMVSLGGRIAGEREVGLDSSASDHAAVAARVPAREGDDRLRDGGSQPGPAVHRGCRAWGEPLGRRVDPRPPLLIAVALMPFAALGVGLGHLLTVDSVGPAIGGTVSLLALVSGTWFPITSGFLHDLGQFLPSYWLVQAGRVSIDGQPWGAMGWAVVLGWTVVLVAFAALGVHARHRPRLTPSRSGLLSRRSARQLLDDLAAAIDQLAFALACVGEAYDELDERAADVLEEEIFKPLQAAYGRAKRTHSEFARRYGLPQRSVRGAFSGHPLRRPARLPGPRRRGDRAGRPRDRGAAGLDDARRGGGYGAASRAVGGPLADRRAAVSGAPAGARARAVAPSGSPTEFADPQRAGVNPGATG